MKTGRPRIWRSATTRLRIAHERRQRDAAALRKLAEAHDAREAERSAKAAAEAEQECAA